MNGSNKNYPEKWSIYHQHGKKVDSKKSTPLAHLGHPAKQVLYPCLNIRKLVLMHAIQIPFPSKTKISPFIEIFYIPNLSVAIPNKFSTDKSKRIT